MLGFADKAVRYLIAGGGSRRPEPGARGRGSLAGAGGRAHRGRRRAGHVAARRVAQPPARRRLRPRARARRAGDDERLPATPGAGGDRVRGGLLASRSPGGALRGAALECAGDDRPPAGGPRLRPGHREPRARACLHRLHRRGAGARQPGDRAGRGARRRPPARRHPAGEPVARAAPGDAPAKLERATRLSALALRTGDLGQLGPAAYYRGAISYLRGDPESMDARLRRPGAHRPRHGTGLLRLHGRLHGLRAAVHRGRVRRCRAHLRRPAGDG